MIAIDFLIYYLTYWFEKNKKRLVWSTPLQRAIYATVFAMAGLFSFIETILESTFWKQSNFKISSFFVVLAAVVLNQLLNYVYVKQGRYESISASGFKMNKNMGTTISISIIFLCAIGFLIGYMLIVPAGT